MQRHRRLVEGAGDRFIRLLVVFFGQLRFRPLPQRAGRIDLARLALFRHQFDRKLDIVRVVADDAFDLVSFQIFFGIRLQMQHDLGAPRDTLGILFARLRDLESAAAGRRPHPDLVGSGTAAGDDDALGDHEGGIEADPELADQIGAFLGLGQAGQKGLGAGARDGAEIVDQFLARHADAVVDHRKRIRLLVGHDADFRRLAVGDQLRRGNRLVAQFVAGIRRVRDQFAQEDVGFRIDRMHHQVQEFGHFSLERLGFSGHGGIGGHSLARWMSGTDNPENPI